MQSIRPPSFMTGRGPPPPTKPCAFAYANTLATNPQLHFFFPPPFAHSPRAHCERCADCGNNSILASLHLHLLAFMVHLSVVIRILVQAKDLMITR